MLQHLYTLDYSGHKISIGDEEEPSHASNLHTHASMYALGDQYDIPDLKEEALWKFKRSMGTIEGHSDSLTSVVGVIPTVYGTTPSSDRGLRDAVVAFGAKNLERIKDMSNFESAVTQAPAFVVEVLPVFLQRLEQRREGERKRQSEPCVRCGQTGNWLFDRVTCAYCQYSKPLGDFETVNAFR